MKTPMNNDLLKPGQMPQNVIHWFSTQQEIDLENFSI